VNPPVDESFAGPVIDSRLVWLNPPPVAHAGPEGLCVETAAHTDLWQGTHYGFRVDNAHALLAEIAGDFQLETWVEFHPRHQYDQAGLLVRLSSDCWLKTSIEFEPDGPSRLGSVVTNGGWSDWATQDVPATLRRAHYRVTRRNGDYLVEFETATDTWTQLRVAHLHDDNGQSRVYAGLYACSPKEAGFRAIFRRLRISAP